MEQNKIIEPSTIIHLKTKKCSRCKRHSYDEDFIRNGRVFKCCFKCSQEYVKHKDKLLPKQKDYYHKNKKKHKDYHKNYYQTNKDYHKNYYQTNKDLISEKQKEYYNSNKDIITEKRRDYYQTNKDIITEKHKEYYISNKDLITEKQKEYYNSNKDSILEKQKDYYNSNKDSILEHKKDYYNSNKDSILEHKKEYYQTNKDSILEKHKDYIQTLQEENPLSYKISVMICSSKSNDLKRNRPFNDEDYINSEFLHELYNKQNGKCFYCQNFMTLTIDNNKDCNVITKNKLTIQRLDNEIAHIKKNIVFACFFCNCIAHLENISMSNF
jgi:hypothetical protein